jgi:hypothetical protein
LELLAAVPFLAAPLAANDLEIHERLLDTWEGFKAS